MMSRTLNNIIQNKEPISSMLIDDIGYSCK